MKQTGYIFQHRPTGQFVCFDISNIFEDEIIMSFSQDIVQYCVVKNKDTAVSNLKQAIDKNGDRYGYDNFLEFDLLQVEIETQITIIKHEPTP